MKKKSRADISRENGAKSNGPITAEGKKRSSMNALKHGLAAKSTLLLQNESTEKLQSIFDSGHALFRPQDDIEATLVDLFCGSIWRLRRIFGMESAMIDVEKHRMREEVDREFSAIDERSRNTLAFQALAESSPAFQNLLRYEGRTTRTLKTTLSNLDRLREERLLRQDDPPPQPVLDDDPPPAPPPPEPEPACTPAPTPDPPPNPTKLKDENEPAPPTSRTYDPHPWFLDYPGPPNFFKK